MPRGRPSRLWAVVADTDEEAERLAYGSRMATAMLRRGRLIPVPPAVKAERFPTDEGLLTGRLADGWCWARRGRCPRESSRSRACTVRRR